MLCRRCGQVRDESEFRQRDGKLMMPCKKCHLEYGRRHYQNNKQYYKDKAKVRNNAISAIYHLRDLPSADLGLPP